MALPTLWDCSLLESWEDRRADVVLADDLDDDPICLATLLPEVPVPLSRELPLTEERPAEERLTDERLTDERSDDLDEEAADAFTDELLPEVTEERPDVEVASRVRRLLSCELSRVPPTTAVLPDVEFPRETVEEPLSEDELLETEEELLDEDEEDRPDEDEDLDEAEEALLEEEERL